MTPVDQLDLSTVLKLSQTVQRENDLARLITAIMRLGLEHAGAERGLLIAPHGDGHRVEAEVTSGPEGVTVELRQAGIGAGDLPQSVPQIEAPLLCLVATEDHIIPSAHSRVLFDAWRGAKTWREVPRSDHESISGEPEYWRSIAEFLKALR